MFDCQCTSAVAKKATICSLLLGNSVVYTVLYHSHPGVGSIFKNNDGIIFLTLPCPLLLLRPVPLLHQCLHLHLHELVLWNLILFVNVFLPNLYKPLCFSRAWEELSVFLPCLPQPWVTLSFNSFQKWNIYPVKSLSLPALCLGILLLLTTPVPGGPTFHNHKISKLVQKCSATFTCTIYIFVKLTPPWIVSAVPCNHRCWWTPAVYPSMEKRWVLRL